MPDKAFSPQTHLILMRQRNQAPDPFFPNWKHSKIPSLFTLDIPQVGIFICDRNSNIR